MLTSREAVFGLNFQVRSSIMQLKCCVLDQQSPVFPKSKTLVCTQGNFSVVAGSRATNTRLNLSCWSICALSNCFSVSLNQLQTRSAENDCRWGSFLVAFLYISCQVYISAAEGLAGAEVDVPWAPGNVLTGDGERECSDAWTVLASVSILAGDLSAEVILRGIFGCTWV